MEKIQEEQTDQQKILDALGKLTFDTDLRKHDEVLPGHDQQEERLAALKERARLAEEAGAMHIVVSFGPNHKILFVDQSQDDHAKLGRHDIAGRTDPLRVK